MNKKLFVGGLSWDTEEQSIEQIFGEYGKIEELKLIRDRETGRSKGFAFVTFQYPDSAQEAVQQLNGTDLDGRKIKVNEAEDRSSSRRSPGIGRFGGGGGGNSRNRY